MSGGRSKLIGSVLCSIFWMLMGVLLCVGSFLIPTIQTEVYLKWIVLALGVLLVVLSVVCVAVFAAKIKKLPSQKTLKVEENVKKQTGEQKLAQIDLMEHAQFVVHVARLFQNKGYTVDFVPISGDSGVSFVAEINGKSFAVICVLSHEDLSYSAVRAACEDWNKHPCQSAIVVTNAYLDRAASGFARKNKLHVIDRHDLVNEYF